MNKEDKLHISSVVDELTSYISSKQNETSLQSILNQLCKNLEDQPADFKKVTQQVEHFFSGITTEKQHQIIILLLFKYYIKKRNTHLYNNKHAHHNHKHGDRTEFVVDIGEDDGFTAETVEKLFFDSLEENEQKSIMRINIRKNRTFILVEQSFAQKVIAKISTIKIGMTSLRVSLPQNKPYGNKQTYLGHSRHNSQHSQQNNYNNGYNNKKDRYNHRQNRNERPYNRKPYQHKSSYTNREHQQHNFFSPKNTYSSNAAMHSQTNYKSNELPTPWNEGKDTSD